MDSDTFFASSIFWGQFSRHGVGVSSSDPKGGGEVTPPPPTTTKSDPQQKGGLTHLPPPSPCTHLIPLHKFSKQLTDNYYNHVHIIMITWVWVISANPEFKDYLQRWLMISERSIYCSRILLWAFISLKMRWQEIAPGPSGHRCIKLVINGNFAFYGNYHGNKTP